MSFKFRGIDVSRWQGKNIDFEKVKADGYDFVILKAGGSDSGYYQDSMFEINYKKAKNAGLSVGAYYFAGAAFVSTLFGIFNAAAFHNIIKGKTFEFPVFIDVEQTPTDKKQGATDATIAFCEHFETHGYFVGVYGSDVSTFQNRLQNERLEKYTRWVARYGSAPEYSKFQIWQFTSNGTVAGIAGNVDLNVTNIDYKSIIIGGNFNGFK